MIDHHPHELSGKGARVPVKRRAEVALIDRLERLVGGELDRDGRVPDVEQAVVGTIDDAVLAQALADVAQGSGGELAAYGEHRPKFHSAFSSCALAVNVFAPWRLDPRNLELAGQDGFDSLRFEVKCPIFAARATPPNLDVLLHADGTTVGVESKLTEYLAGRQTAQFAERYGNAVGELFDEPWRNIYEHLLASPDHYRFLNAAQLTKHALGLRRCHGDDELTLLYAYWEPRNRVDLPTFAEHRREIDDFAHRTAGSSLRFRAFSYPELWRAWRDSTDPQIVAHAVALEERYAVSI